MVFAEVCGRQGFRKLSGSGDASVASGRHLKTFQATSVFSEVGGGEIPGKRLGELTLGML